MGLNLNADADLGFEDDGQRVIDEIHLGACRGEARTSRGGGVYFTLGGGGSFDWTPKQNAFMGPLPPAKPYPTGGAAPA
jgi:hypothetical protein